jgi:hypothetical protein
VLIRAGVAQSIQCLTTDWTAGVRSLTGEEDFSSNLCVQTGSGAHPASYTMGTGGSFPGGKARPGRDADHSAPSSAEVKKEWGYTSCHPNASLWSVTGPLYLFLWCVNAENATSCPHTLHCLFAINGMKKLFIHQSSNLFRSRPSVKRQGICRQNYLILGFLFPVKGPHNHHIHKLGKFRMHGYLLGQIDKLPMNYVCPSFVVNIMMPYQLQVILILHELNVVGVAVICFTVLRWRL